MKGFQPSRRGAASECGDHGVRLLAICWCWLRGWSSEPVSRRSATAC